MKVRFVLCHRVADVYGEERQVFLAEALNRAGHDAAVYGISKRSEAFEGRHRHYNTRVALFQADDLAQAPHTTTSAAMLRCLTAEAPDRIVVKGVDYAQAREIFKVFPAERLSVIVGGVSSHPLLERCGSVYFETARQLDSYKGAARTTLLPKLIAWEQVKPHGESGIEYDVINIGNFEEARKAQELLLPFALKYRVMLLGAGRRLEAFKQICESYRNITFGGYLRDEHLFDCLSRSRLMIHSSVWDGYPRVVAESLAAGVPVLGLEGVLDGIADQPLVRCAPIEKLHELGFALLSDTQRLDSVGVAAAAYMKQTSSHEVLLERFLGIIR